MNGLITQLPQYIHDEVEKIWEQLHVLFGINRVKSTTLPHLTWVIAQECDETKVKDEIDRLRKRHFPFVIKTNGIGIFTGKRPAVYIQIKPTVELLKFQSTLFEVFSKLSKKPKKHYIPHRWIPHISLAIEDVSDENIAKLIAYLLPITFKHDVRIESISLVRRKKGMDMEVLERFFLAQKNDPDSMLRD